MVSQPSPPGNRNNDKTIPASVTPIYDSTGENVQRLGKGGEATWLVLS